MPHSTHHPLTQVMDHVVRMQPRTVLDVGVGYGKWGLLVRESLDWLQDRHDPATWQTHITGLEAFEDYTSPLYGWVYDEIIYDDIVHYARDCPPYDLVVMGDVIEHLPKQEGLAVLETLLAKCRNVVVATPVDFFTQDILDNPWEQHHSLWSLADFRPWTFDYDVVGKVCVVAALAGVGATYPTPRQTQASEAAYRLPGMSHQGTAAKVVKQLITRLGR